MLHEAETELAMVCERGYFHCGDRGYITLNCYTKSLMPVHNSCLLQSYTIEWGARFSLSVLLTLPLLVVAIIPPLSAAMRSNSPRRSCCSPSAISFLSCFNASLARKLGKFLSRRCLRLFTAFAQTFNQGSSALVSGSWEDCIQREWTQTTP